MASISEDIHKISLPITAFPPTVVKVFPTCALVERESKAGTITIKPGRNKITIQNLTRHADEQSVKVEGLGDAAVISDISVDCLPNATLWAEDDDDDEIFDSGAEDDLESDTEENIAKLVGDEAVGLVEDIKVLREKLQELEEGVGNARNRLTFLERFGNTMVSDPSGWGDRTDGAESTKTLEHFLVIQSRECRENQEFLRETHKTILNLQREIKRKEKEKDKLLRDGRRQYKRRVEVSRRAREERHQAFLDRMAEKGPKYGPIHRVVVWIEGTGKGDSDIALKLSYITTNASWSPRYDINLTTGAVPTAHLTYKAHVVNESGEMWNDCTVVLSTSQATFKGLQDHAPTLEPWNLRLVQGTDFRYRNLSKAGKDKVLLYSEQEKPGWLDSLARSEGVVQQPMKNSAKMFRSARRGSAPHIETTAAPAPKTWADSSDDQLSTPHRNADGESDSEHKEGGPIYTDGESEDESSAEESESLTLNYAQRKMRFATPSQQSSGLTTTYTLSSPLTIPSSPLPRRHLIAEIALPNVKLEHLCIPKLRPAVFLKAKIKNTSPMPLLKGSSGLTLDGSFLGTLNLPGAQPSEEFTLPLGVDTSVHVVYGKVVRKRALEKGIWNKEARVGFSRSITIQNARPTPVSLIVIDQVPVSEDERIKVTVLSPRGIENGPVNTGVPIGDDKNGKGSDAASNISLSKRMSTLRGPAQEWGVAKAGMKKGGKVKWDVQLQGGKGAGLELDYQLSFPKDSGVMTAV